MTVSTVSSARAPTPSQTLTGIEDIPTQVQVAEGDLARVRASISPDYETTASAMVTMQGFSMGPGPKRSIEVQSVSVYEAGTDRLVARIDDPVLLARDHDHHDVYRVDVPVSQLDPAKRYTFVANARFSGGEPFAVRSEYVGVPTRHRRGALPTLDSAFDRFDANRDRSLTSGEANELARRVGAPTLWSLGGMGPFDLFAALDLDGDHLATKGEFAEKTAQLLFDGLPGDSGGTPAERARVAVDRLLARANGAVSDPQDETIGLDELAVVLGRAMHIQDGFDGAEERLGMARMVMSLLDESLEGVLDRRELLSYATDLATRLAGDGDRPAP